jgi:hypothetical protein
MPPAPLIRRVNMAVRMAVYTSMVIYPAIKDMNDGHILSLVKFIVILWYFFVANYAGLN